MTEETYLGDLNRNSGDKFHTGWDGSSEVTDLKPNLMPVATQEFRQDQAGSKYGLQIWNLFIERRYVRQLLERKMGQVGKEKEARWSWQMNCWAEDTIALVG